MSLPLEFVPEARRLLRLARDDRRAASAQLADLAPEEQATVVLEAPLALRHGLIDLLPAPEAVIPLLPEAELCYTCKAIGLEDSAWLLSMATDDQIVACLDLDAWSGLTIEPHRLESWMAALASTDEATLLRAARAMDPELISLFLRHHIEVHLKPSPQDDPDWSPPENSQTLEGQFYFVARREGDDLAPLLALLHALFRGDYWLYFRMIQSVPEELTAETEEWALRWRSGRLEDLGFPTWDSSMRIYGFLRPERLTELPERSDALDVESWAMPVWITELPGLRADERALFRVARELDAEGRSSLFYALIALANRVAVADRLDLGDPDSLPKAIDKATRLASDGLEHLAKERSLSFEQVVRRASLERLFRIGVNLDPEAELPPSIASEDDGA